MEKAIKKKNRDSNIELLRIIAMCLIIFHHMALNTGIVDGYSINGNMIFGIIGGIGGKIGVVIFFIPTIVDLVFGFISNFTGDIMSEIATCEECLLSPTGNACEDSVDVANAEANQ